MKRFVLKFKQREMVRSLMSSGFLYIFCSNAVNQVVRFAYGIFILRIISKESFGIYSYANNIFQFFILLSGLGISSAVMQLGSERGQDTRIQDSCTHYGYYFGFRFNIVLSLLILITSLLIPLPIKGSNKILLYMCLLPLLHVIKENQVVWLRIQLRNSSYAKANIYDTLIITALTVIFGILWQADGIVMAQYAAYIILIWYLLKKENASVLLDRPVLSHTQKKDLLKIAGISTINNSLSQVLGLLGVFILGLIVKSESTIAAYKAGSTIPTALSFIPSSLMIFAYPHFARHKDDREWTKAKYVLLMKYGSLANAIITIIGILISRPLVILLFGHGYTDAIIPFRVMMLGFFFSATFKTVSGNLLVTQRKLLFNLFIGILGALISIALNLLLIPKYASTGAAVSQLITMAVTGIISTIYYIEVLKKIPAGTCAGDK